MFHVGVSNDVSLSHPLPRHYLADACSFYDHLMSFLRMYWFNKIKTIFIVQLKMPRLTFLLCFLIAGMLNTLVGAFINVLCCRFKARNQLRDDVPVDSSMTNLLTGSL